MSPLILFIASLASADITPPQVLDDRMQIQLVAAEPDVVTPTGLAVDDRGRVLAIESHTHFRPQGYQGPKADRILMLDDFDPATGKTRKISVFFEGTTHTMSLAVYHDGSIYVATRREIFRLRDKDGDGRADERTEICHLETEGNYPHNGLSGFAFDFAGNVYFGFGENLGADYKLVGSDGNSLAGGGEGGNIYTCLPDGSNVRRVATGFWNPFHLTFDAFGRLFAVDNDPDSRPPCRLLHIVEGGDYGYRFRNGRKGIHPFTAWNGELPGTLPMVAGTGEAPCAVLAYESDNLPDEYRGDLLVTSWGDHRLERYRLKPRGASFSAEMTPVLRGDENFRPVGLALAPDGSLYFSDWVDKSYHLHGKGRVWRLSSKKPPRPNRPADSIAALTSPHGPWREAAARKLTREQSIEVASQSKWERARSLAARRCVLTNHRWAQAFKDEAGPEAAAEMAAIHQFSECIARLLPAEFALTAKVGEHHSRSLVEKLEPQEEREFDRVFEKWDVTRFVDLKQPAELRAAAQLFRLMPARRRGEDPWQSIAEDPFLEAALLRFPGDRVGMAASNRYRRRLSALALRREDAAHSRMEIPKLLKGDDETIQLIAVQWIGESGLREFRGQLEALLATSAGSRRLFEAIIAAIELLDGGRPGDPKAETSGQDYVARLLLSETTSDEVRRFALRTLRPDHPAVPRRLLEEFVKGEDQTLRLEAIRTIRQRADAERWPQLRQIAADSDRTVQERCEAILGLSPGNEDDRKLLLELTIADTAVVADEALRALRGLELRDGERQQLTQLAAKLDGPRKELALRVLARNPPGNQPKPDDQAAWLKLAEGAGDPQAGERIFYHARVGGCFRCHEFEGRGHRIGPDLTNIGRTMTRERLVQSIVDPSREIAPMFTNWTLLTAAGEVKTGIHVGDEVDGRIKFADASGRIFHVHPNDIDRRQPSNLSVMPAGLAENLTPQELRDLLAFLQSDNKSN